MNESIDSSFLTTIRPCQRCKLSDAFGPKTYQHELQKQLVISWIVYSDSFLNHTSLKTIGLHIIRFNFSPTKTTFQIHFSHSNDVTAARVDRKEFNFITIQQFDTNIRHRQYSL
mmetsp:Transcript_2882/g.7918  ORF Transcript_2882/g.7918 Transcript_2882/m.7918 type:complete len:114 (+) Transcript_2882:2037-2378(+)